MKVTGEMNDEDELPMSPKYEDEDKFDRKWIRLI